MKKIYLTLTGMFLLAAVAVAQTPYASYPLDGNADDVAGNNLDGNIFGSPNTTSNRYSQNGKALNFDGQTDYIEMPVAFDFPNRTVILWFNASQVGSANGYNLIYSCDHPGLQNGMTSLSLYTDNNLGDVIKISTDQHNYIGSVSINQWYQIAVVRSPSIVKFFVNGVQVYSNTNPNGATSNNAVSTKTVIGADRGYDAKFFGKIDDISVYDTDVADAVVANNYNSLKDVHEIESKLNVYVASGNVHYQLPETLLTSVQRIGLFDVQGKLILEDQLQFDGVLTCQHLPAGVYFLSIAVEGASKPITRKVVINE